MDRILRSVCCRPVELASGLGKNAPRRRCRVAVGSLAFVEKVKADGAKALHRDREQMDGTYALRESGEAYSGQFDGCLVPDHMDNSMVL